MSDQPASSQPNGPAGPGSVRRALSELESALLQATQATMLLRRALDGAPPEHAPPPDTSSTPALAVPARLRPAAEPSERSSSGASFEQLWDRIEHERREKGVDAEGPAAERRGLDLLPQQYLMTVEDRETKVDLVPLHRALLGLVPVENIALLSFANGVPVISLHSEGELDLERLGAAVSNAMDRDCEVIAQDTGRLFLRLSSRKEREA
jgi:hypothetical protein